jgi:hypothetical protein
MPNLAAKPHLRWAHSCLLTGATLSMIPTIPVADTASVLGMDLFLSTFHALINMIGDAGATPSPGVLRRYRRYEDS